jgi:hypothetical protein
VIVHQQRERRRRREGAEIVGGLWLHLLRTNRRRVIARFGFRGRLSGTSRLG